MVKENWKIIPDFTNYSISDLGRVYNIDRDIVMQTSINNFGHVKITLVADYDGERYTRSVANLVAEAFILAPNVFCDQVVVLDGDLSNVRADNLVWRPVGFSWKYARQMRTPQPVHFHNLPVKNLMTGQRYESIIEAGINEGLLFKEIWDSTYKGTPTFPDGNCFEVINILQRV